MANPALFASASGTMPATDIVNEAGGAAYSFTAKHALAQIAATGTFNGVYYTKPQDQLDKVIELAHQIDDNEFIAKLAIYSRKHAQMKDMPAALTTILLARDTKLFHTAFTRAIDNGRMMRNVFQMILSGKFGRKKLGSSAKRAFQIWLNEASANMLLAASIGDKPSLRDVLRLARPVPRTDERRALFGWLVGKGKHEWGTAGKKNLPLQVVALRKFRKQKSVAKQLEALEMMPRVRWDLLSGTAINDPLIWSAIADRMGLMALRMNLNTLARHDVIGFEPKHEKMVGKIAERLSDKNEVISARQFPYQFLAAYKYADESVPQVIRTALSTAADHACANVPKLPGPIVIGLDVSGSMGCAVTGGGWNSSDASKMRHVDVAALFAVAMMRRNPDSVLIPFDHTIHDAKSFDPNDTILSLSQRLAQFGGGGTNCALPLAAANQMYSDRKFAGCVLISDNESWIDTGRRRSYGSGSHTETMGQWKQFVDRHKPHGIAPKLVCIDIAPYGSTQAPDRKDILNVGGFNDSVFTVINSFMSSGGDFVSEVEKVQL